MAKIIEKIINIECDNCGEIFLHKVNIKIGKKNTSEKTEIDVECPHCHTLLTITIEGGLKLNNISLRSYKSSKK